MAILGWIAMASPHVPYNIRELFAGDHRLLTLLVLVVTLYWSFGIPIWLTLWFKMRFWLGTAIVPSVVIHGLIAYGLLRISVPMESIHDIVGSPICNWPWEWELLGRFVALFAVFSLMLCGGALAVLATRSGRVSQSRLLWRWVGITAVFFPILHWVVVTNAATDNLTELMAGGGSWFATVLLCGWLFIVAFAASGVSARAAGVARYSLGTGVLMVLCSLLLGYFAFRWGTANEIHKYGQQFSAMQFLLSPDRAHYVEGWILAFRYAVAHILAVGMIAITQYPFWISIMGDRGRKAVIPNTASKSEMR